MFSRYMARQVPLVPASFARSQQSCAREPVRVDP